MSPSTPDRSIPAWTGLVYLPSLAHYTLAVVTEVCDGLGTVPCGSIQTATIHTQPTRQAVPEGQAADGLQ
ncbi:MAG: hypothetical protein HKN37_11605 [Rhodothermales bacterium]|nr:hypothetical protein [Rhodothermales bacterium]